MFEIFVAVVCFLLLSTVIMILLVINAAENVVGAVVRDVHDAVDGASDGRWRQAGALERERMVRRACSWRVLGRVAAATALITSGVFVVTSPGLIFGCCVSAWRLLSPIKDEMRDACAYKSTGAEDDPRY
jgi:hypothetical protein